MKETNVIDKQNLPKATERGSKMWTQNLAVGYRIQDPITGGEQPRKPNEFSPVIGLKCPVPARAPSRLCLINFHVMGKDHIDHLT